MNKLLELKQFPIHLAYTKNKKAANKFIKLNYQSIYNGKINRFSRATVMDNIHEYVKVFINRKIKLDTGIKLHFEFHTVINHGDIKLIKHELCWKEPKKDYEPSWDIENLAGIWIKGINDTLVLNKVIEDDNIKYIRGVSYEFIPVTELNNRKIVVYYKS